MKAMQSMGYSVTGINICRPPRLFQRFLSKIFSIIGFGWQPDWSGVNHDIKRHISKEPFDVFWVDKGTSLKASTLKWIKKQQPECRLVHLNPDDPFGVYRKGWGVFLKAVPSYDVHFVARTQNVEELARMGGQNIFSYDRSFSKELHRPVQLSSEEEKRYKVPVGFIGTYADDRARIIAHLIQNGVPVAVSGDGWPMQRYWKIIRPHYRGTSRYGDDYVKTINGMGIALHFLRHENRDEQDSRTFEIPACGVFMLAERGRKHEMFFRENEEAVFFDAADELLEKVRYYLSHPDEARRIAAAGRRRCLESGYDHHSRMKQLLEIVFET
jgi:hypothetical protein